MSMFYSYRHKLLLMVCSYCPLVSQRILFTHLHINVHLWTMERAQGSFVAVTKVMLAYWFV